jgi:hypothetical protein
VRAPEVLHGMRVVAAPEVLDALTAASEHVVLRFAPDDVFVLDALDAHDALSDDAIVVDEAGFVGWWLTDEELTTHVVAHVEWPLPVPRPVLAQGLVAGVPAKLWLTGETSLLLCAAPYAHELTERLG